MNDEDRSRLFREVQLSGGCSNPIRLRGEMVNLATGEVVLKSLRVACRDRRRSVCPSCSFLYKADAWILVSAGLIGGKGTPSEVSTHPRQLVTLTAPSFGSVHTVRDDGRCVRRPQFPQEPGTCDHGVSMFCGVRHENDDARLGQPLCDRCFDYAGAVLWNAHASKLWNKTVQMLRRSLAEKAGVAQDRLKSTAQLHYLKVAEMQRRGLVHFHVLLRVDGPDGIDVDPPEWLSSDELARAVQHSVKESKVLGLTGGYYQWGRMFDIRDLGVNPGDPNKVASYVAKYTTKTTDGTKDLAYRFHHRRQIQNLSHDLHARRLALTAWDLADRLELAPLNLRDHAHTFGFTGQLITKSRHFSTTFAAMRSARANFMKDRNTGEPVAGTFYYDGRGYEHPLGTELAELFFSMQQKLRDQALKARLSTKSAS